MSVLNRQIVALLSIFTGLYTSFAEGLDFFAPRSKDFSERGVFIYALPFSMISLNPGVTLPITAIYRPSWQSYASFIGQGWYLPLLDSHAVYENDTTLKVEMPDGQNLRLYKNKQNVFVDYSGEWSASMSTTVLRLNSKQRDSIVFENGKVKSFKTDSGTFAINRNGDKSIELFKDGKTLIKLTRSGKELISGQIDKKPLLINLSKIAFFTKLSTGAIVNQMHYLPNTILIQGKTIADIEYIIDPQMPDVVNFSVRGSIPFAGKWNQAGNQISHEPNKSTNKNEVFRSGNAANRMRKFVDNGEITKFTYDELGRLLRVKAPSFIMTKVASGYLVTNSNGTRTFYDFAKGSIINNFNDELSPKQQ